MDGISAPASLCAPRAQAPPLSGLARAAMLLLTLLSSAAQTPAQAPPAGRLPRQDPAAAGFDAEALAAAVAFAKAHPTDWPKDFSTQARIFGARLGPLPKTRADTNGLVIKGGRVVAEFGDVTAVDPTYSVAKSLLSTTVGIAVREHLIADLDRPVRELVHDGGYDQEHNRGITWRQHLQQESEWQGSLWGRADDFVGAEAFGQGERKPRELQAPGSHYEYNDVRINRLALSMLRVFDRPVPDVFGEQVMKPIGASTTWRWLGYDDAKVEQHGIEMVSVSGGSRWGAGVWIHSEDLARIGLLWLHRGRWGERQILPADYVTAALTPSRHGPDYGYLWWLNQKGRNWPGLPTNAFGARGAGNNTVFVSPDHDLVIVWRWHSGADHADAKFFAMVIAALRPPK